MSFLLVNGVYSLEHGIETGNETRSTVGKPDRSLDWAKGWIVTAIAVQRGILDSGVNQR